MDCGQGKNNNNDNNDPATRRMSNEVGVGVDVAFGVGVDVASGKVGKRTSNGEDAAMGNNSAEDVPKAIAPERPRRRAYVAHLARRRRRGGCRCVLSFSSARPKLLYEHLHCSTLFLAAYVSCCILRVPT